MTEQVISHYQIIEKLGAGGMGEVYLAEDTTLGRRVALKLLPQEYTQDEERVRRFKQEARAASALNHPNILTIHEVGEAEGHYFIATEFVDGESLRALVGRNGRLETGAALGVAVQVASALATAHEAGIVHRDVKPDNIMLRRDGLVKILDFGLAKLTDPVALQSADPNGPTRSLAVHTESGVLLGTAQYMSPEQATGKAVDARSDVFSFGAVLYEMLTGRRAFPGDSMIEAVAAVLNREPLPLPARIPAVLAKVVLRCLRKEPGRRYQTMADLKVALEDVQEESGAGRQVHQIPARLGWSLALLLPLLLGASVFVWQTWRAPESRAPVRAVPLTTLPGVARYPSLSADGNYVAFAWTARQGNTDIYVQQVGAASALRLTTDPSGDYNPVWSPDGRWIAFLRGGSSLPVSGDSELRLIPPLGGPERKVADVRVPDILGIFSFLAWCPDSTCLVVTDAQGEGRPAALFVVSLETGEKRQLTAPEPTAVGDSGPAVSPDGRTLVFRRNASGGLTGQLYSLPLGEDLIAGSPTVALTPPAQNANDPTWMPDGREILYSAGGGLWRLAVPGPGQPMRLPFVGEDGLMPVVSRPGAGKPLRLAYVRSFRDENIWRVDTPGFDRPALSSPAVAIASTRLDLNPQLSPDGRRVAFQSDRSGSMEVWLADPDGANAVQLTSLGAPTTGTARWSPDAQLITFNSNLEGQWEIYVVSATGGRPRRLTSHPANDNVPSFSRDGRWVYFSSNRTGQFEIWKAPTSGGDAVQLSHNVGYVPFESPDGAYVYYTQTVSAASGLWRLPVSGGEPVKVLEGVVFRNFVVLDRGVYYINQVSGEATLQFFDFVSHRSTTLARGLGDIRYGLTATADGRTILYSRVDSTLDDLMLVDNFR